MRGLILLEGNKSTFKGTIAAYLAKCFNCDIEKGIPKGNASLLKTYKKLEDAQNYLFSFWKKKIDGSMFRLVIYDRTFITPIVYTKAFEDDNRQFVFLSEEHRIDIERLIASVPYALIYLHDSVDNLWNRYIERGSHEIAETDYMKERSEIALLNRRYEDYFKNVTQLSPSINQAKMYAARKR